MNIRAVIFDVYATLLEVGPPPADAGALWDRLWWEQFAAPARASLTEFSTACASVIVREHASSRHAGIAFPEIHWPTVATEALPELAQLTAAAREEFLFRHAGMIRTPRLAPAAETLRFLRDAQIPLGIASNAQPYTLRELETALASAHLSLALFAPAFCFWSFEHGFSKPDPHVFHLLSARLRVHGIAPAETLMIGDRFDNDIAPARTAGWQTWHLHPDACDSVSGDWKQLRRWLESSL